MKRGYSTTPLADRRKRLRDALQGTSLLVAPGVYDMISAKMADTSGFSALYMTGYGTVASYLGLPDAGLANGTDMLDRVEQTALVTETPLICDADTGYGGLLNVMHTVRSYERAGACAIQLEDQCYPKKCGHMPGRQVVAPEEMEARIRVALDSRQDDNTVIIARTDARTSYGLDEALRRAERYARAGADVLFVESPESEHEMRRICSSVDIPVLANMVEGGRTPVLPPEQLEALGFRIGIFPATGFLGAAQVFSRIYQALAKNRLPDVELYPFESFSHLMGFDWVKEFDEKYSRTARVDHD